MPGLNPYVGYSQQQRMPGYGGGAYGGGYGGYGSRYGMGMRPPAAAVTGPVGSSSSANPEAYAEGARQMESQQARAQESTSAIGATRNNLAEQGQEDQAKNIAAYRQVRDSGIGRDNANTSSAQRTQAIDLGIDPGSDAHEIASAASGPIQPGANGVMAGGDTGNGSLAPNSTDVATAAAAAQARKTGAQVATTNAAYIAGSGTNTRGQTATGADPFTAGIAPKATPNLTTRPMPGVPAQAATQPVQTPAQVTAPATKPATPGVMPKLPPVGPFPLRQRKQPMQTLPLATT